MPNTLNLPKELIEKLQIKIKETDFKSIKDYVIYVLNQLVNSKEKMGEVSKDESVNYTPEEAYSPEEEKEMKKRLKDMGYI